MKITALFRSLRHKEFAKLYAAQSISLLGDAFTWLGVALLAFEFAGEKASVILAVTLTLRVTAFILFAPYAGVLADKYNRKTILLLSDFSRMLLVALFPFIASEWQLYVLMFFLNVFSAFFTPAFKASIPQLVENNEEFAPAIALSNATYQLLGIMGPALAGSLAAWLGIRQIFFLDAFTFLLSALLVLSISSKLFSLQSSDPESTELLSWQQMLKGTRLLFRDPLIRFALFIELCAAIIGAYVLVNTVQYVKGSLALGNKEYGWVMSALAIGAALAAFGFSYIDKTKTRRPALLTGIFVLCIAVLPAGNVSLFPLLILWLVAGFGQNLAEMPSQMLIAERVPLDQQGRVYGAHFAWSHLWWAIGYPLAGFLGSNTGDQNFMIAGIISFIFFIIIIVTHSFFKQKVHEI